jgi:hypothetical protein
MATGKVIGALTAGTGSTEYHKFLAHIDRDAAMGAGSRPSAWRTWSRNTSWMSSHTPNALQYRNHR